MGTLLNLRLLMNYVMAVDALEFLLHFYAVRCKTTM